MEKWTLKGELILNCSCTIFCPCVVSLGKHPPTEGQCQGWAGIRIDEGQSGETDLSGLNVALLLDIPGNMARGNWTAAAYIDERASDAAFEKLVNIFSGKARGTTGLFSILVSTFLGAERAPVSFEREGEKRRLVVPKRIIGEVEPIGGKDPGSHVVITNTEYWMGPDITVAKANQGRVRAFGRVWDFDGRSAEICAIDWRGP
ncbi:DUF1326 domain-containing protein [Dongia mobilis]|jgi:hypothetical protein|uniref:DUF1326 domain-containing protein n=1 Tax=Dongia sp. TaxID=1977262 RepID=UPI0026EE35F4